MKLKSFGCSFIFGSELADDGIYAYTPRASRSTWPAHLANHIGAEYECYARPGAGNLQILEQVLNQAAQPAPAVFVIGWTWIDRFDYYPSDINPDSFSPWRTIMPVDDSEVAHVYYRDLHSEYRDKLSNLGNIKLVIDTLTQKQIPFVMTYIDELLFDQRWNTSAAVLDMQKYVQPYMTTFDGMTFLEWSRHNGYAETKNWHPLEPAHAAAAELIKSDNLV